MHALSHAGANTVNSKSMRILLASRHRYPASVGGIGGARVFDGLAKGLAELGHEVFYYVQQGLSVPLPCGVRLVQRPIPPIDIVHTQDTEFLDELDVRGIPWAITRHVDPLTKGKPRRVEEENVIYVSRTLADVYQKDHFVLNGIDPDEFFYSEVKLNDLLFICVLERAMGKGLDIAIRSARRAERPLIVAGSSWDPLRVEEMKKYCAAEGVTYVGEIYGAMKARLLAEARALIFPTQWNESFGLVLVEALMSGTPVICSHYGACPELITSDVGFLCDNDDEYVEAIRKAHTIAPSACREVAMRRFHYRVMAEGYLKQNERIIAAELVEVPDYSA